MKKMIIYQSQYERIMCLAVNIAGTLFRPPDIEYRQLVIGCAVVNAPILGWAHHTLVRRSCGVPVVYCGAHCQLSAVQ